jgi:hypothetical protein
MAYGRRLKPRIYPCLIQHLIHRGESSVVTVDSANDITPDVSILRAFDGQPSVRCSWPTASAGAADQIIIKIDLKHSAYTVNYVAILNHNLLQADASVALYRSDTDNYAGATQVTSLAEIVGSDAGSGSIATPDENGSHIYGFSSSTPRYVWITISATDVGGWSATDLEIGDIMLGTHCTAPHGPDIGMSTGVLHNGGKLLESYGGARHYMSGWTTGSDGQSLPFGPPFKVNNIASTNYIEAAIHPGRRYWEFTLSYLADTAVNQEDLSTGVVNPTTFTNVYAMTAGPALPFIFAPDSTSTTVGDYAFARFADDDYQQEEVAFGVVTLNRRIEEEF